MPAKLSQQRKEIRWSIPLSVVSPFALLDEQREQLLLYRGSQRVGVAKASQNGGHNEALLGLPHIFLAGSQFQTMLDQTRASALLDLTDHLRNEPCRHIFHHDRLQREAPLQLARLNERAAAQALDRFQHLSAPQGYAEYRQQLLQGHRLAQDRQPPQHAL